MPNFIRSLQETEDTIDVFVTTNASSHGAHVVIYAPKRKWPLSFAEHVEVRAWLMENVPKDKTGRSQVYAWLPGQVTYDNLPKQEFLEFMEEITNGN